MAILLKAFFKKTLLVLASALSLFLILFITILILITSYPKYGVALIDKIFIHSYELSFQDIQFKNIFSNPRIKASGIEISNHKETIEIEDFELSFKLLDFFLEDQLVFNKIYIEGYKTQKKNVSSEEIKNQTKKTNIFNGNNLSIKTNAFNLLASNYYFRSYANQSSIRLINGEINNIPFKNLDLLIDDSGDIFYSGKHDFYENNLDDLGIIKASSFKVADIKAFIESRGYVNAKDSSKNKSIYKVKLYKSNLTFNSGYSVSNIGSLLYADYKNNLYGNFSASLPLQDVIQDINGNVLFQKDIGLELFSNFTFNMNEILEENSYFSLSGKESFKTKLKIAPDQKVSLSLNTDLKNTNVFSSIDEISKSTGEPLLTSINIPDLTEPAYKISNNLFRVFIDSDNKSGYFAFGMKEKINIKNKKGFHIFLNLQEFDFSSISFNSNESSESFIKSIYLKANKFKMLNNSFKDQEINISFDKQMHGSFLGPDLNGEIVIDKTGFAKVNLNNTNFKTLDFMSKDVETSSYVNDSSIINMRIIGNNINLKGEFFEKVNFYLLRNSSLITIDNLEITSQFLNISPLETGERSFFSYSYPNDQYKIRGLFEVDGRSNMFDNIVNYNFDYLKTGMSIQWNSISDLSNLEGKVNFLTKNFSINNDLPNSAFLSTLKILNLDAIVKNLDSDNRRQSSGLLNLTRASGDILFGKKRGLISNPISIETDEAKMLWVGEILKNESGSLEMLNLDMSLRIKISENLPWYAAIFGGIPAVAGTLVFQDLFEENIDAASSISFKVNGTIENPELIRLN